MKVLVVIFLIILITSYCVCVDDEKRLPVDFDEHQVQLDIQRIKAEFSNVKNEVGTLKQTMQQLTSSGISYFHYQIMYIILFISMYDIYIIKKA